ncbi:hypothetical protein H5410_019320 [Solanum commersonii]|uniref:Uncharacterized protein n=1 Tax=Solanum commersonii TaxID=4109 RepID=A0A9J5Z805_SOLCO|nr:hypothetical protein H5410_019320 [Solanum commersonii]
MEPVGHHGQNGHFKGQTIPGATLALVGHYSQNGQLLRSNKSRQVNPYFANFRVQYSPGDLLFTWTSIKTLDIESTWSPRTKRPIFKVKRVLVQSTGFISDLESHCHFRQKFTWTYVKTLAMEPVGHHGHNGPFSKSNKPRTSKPPILLIFLCYSPWDLLVTQNFDVIFTKNLDGPSLRTWLWSQLVTTAKTTHFQGPTNPRAGKPTILKIFMYYSPHDLLVTSNSDVIFAKILHGPSIRP